MRMIISLVLVPWLCFGQPQAVPSVVSGTVKGEDGVVIMGAEVDLKRTSLAAQRGVRHTAWETRTDARGQFRFDGVPLGIYSICAQAPGGAWLNPCAWGNNPLAVSPSATPVTIALKKAAIVSIRIDDPSHWLDLNEGKTAGAHLLLGVRADNFVFYPSTLISTDSSGRNHQLTIPFDTPVNLVVHASFFQLSDASGSPLTRNGSSVIPLLIPAGHNAATIRLTLTGGGR